MIFRFFLNTLFLSAIVLSACEKDDDILDEIQVDNHNLEDSLIDTLPIGVQFARNQEECFQNLAGWPYAYQYVEIDEVPYAENQVQRSTTYTYQAGNEVYKLINPAGEEYIMQSYSRKINTHLTTDDLASLDTSLNLASDWTYQTEILSADLVLVVDGIAHVIQDEWGNS